MDRKVKIKRPQPLWNVSDNTSTVSKLRLYNSLTRKKELFVPRTDNRVLWYCCGPTVYNDCHVGHARCFVSFDVLRRVLSDYFHYDTFYVMNITDIDDKIIQRARREHFFERYKNEKKNFEDILSDIESALRHFEINRDIFGETPDVLYAKYEDVLSAWLDTFQDIDDNSIFGEFSARYERRFFEDMENLNVSPPDTVLRVTEHIETIILFITRLLEAGYAYPSKGSVYFDVNKFNGSANHFYGKLVPEAMGREGTIDFALWKATGDEPSFESPWGFGRPGWHVECSAMAAEMLGSSLDVHSGGCDLKFPHHDNEMAQSEAYFDNDHWVRYFLHTGQITIAGSKMSKSLKNFVTIREALKTYTGRQIRLLFLLHSWKDPIAYCKETFETALQYEKMVQEFLHNARDLIGGGTLKKWGHQEKILFEKFQEIRSLVHEALCDNIDTRRALKNVQALIKFVNIYIQKSKDRAILVQIRSYVLKILNVFGVHFESREDFEKDVMPFVRVMSEFRDAVRKRAIEIKERVILSECDEVRDRKLPELGVRLEDRNGQKAVIKLDGLEK